MADRDIDWAKKQEQDDWIGKVIEKASKKKTKAENFIEIIKKKWSSVNQVKSVLGTLSRR
jgi:hypothetical protein